MNQLLGNLIDDYVWVQLDGILIFSCTKEDHWKHVCMVFDRLAYLKYHVKRKKFELFQRRLSFLVTLSRLLVLVLFRQKLMLSSNGHS